MAQTGAYFELIDIKPDPKGRLWISCAYDELDFERTGEVKGQVVTAKKPIDLGGNLSRWLKHRRTFENNCQVQLSTGSMKRDSTFAKRIQEARNQLEPGQDVRTRLTSLVDRAYGPEDSCAKDVLGLGSGSTSVAPSRT